MGSQGRSRQAPRVPPRAEQAGRLSDSSVLNALFSEAPVGLAVWDAEFRYRRVNDVLAAMNGIPAEQHLGRRVSEVLPELAPQVEELFAEILETGKPQPDRDV